MLNAILEKLTSDIVFGASAIIVGAGQIAISMYFRRFWGVVVSFLVPLIIVFWTALMMMNQTDNALAWTFIIGGLVFFASLVPASIALAISLLKPRKPSNP